MTHQEYIETAQQFIAIPSSVDNRPALQEAVDFIAHLIQPYEGITIERFESNGIPSLLAYAGPTRPATFDVILNAHVDVVPAEPEGFVPRLDGNKLYGRGIYDMKMAALVMTDVFCSVAPTNSAAIGLQIVADEEVGGYDGVAYQLAQGVRSKFVIAGEMTNLEICNETRGVCWVEVAFKGRSAHSGYAWDGQNAVVQASDFARRLLDIFPVPTKKEWTTTANIASITTNNTTYNLVPNEATVQVDFRFTPENHTFDTKKTVEAFLKTINPDIEIKAYPVFEPAVNVSPVDPSLGRLMNALKDITQSPARLIKRYASSDARHFAAYGIPCVEFGLGGANLHANDEYVDIQTIEPFRDTLVTFLQDTSAQPEVLVEAQVRSHQI